MDRVDHRVALAVVDQAEQPAAHAHAQQEVDRLVHGATAAQQDGGADGFDLDLPEPRGLEQCGGLVGVLEREHARSAGQPAEVGKLGVLRHRVAQDHEPLVGLQSLPTDERGPAPRRQGAAEVRERPLGFVEEHDTELADQHVEGAVGEGVGLGVCHDELGVCQRRGASPTGGDLEQRGREVHAERRPSAASRGERRGAAPAPDVEDRLVRLESDVREQGVGERCELTVVAVGVVDVVHRLATVPRLGLLLVGHRVPPVRSGGGVRHRTDRFEPACGRETGVSRETGV